MKKLHPILVASLLAVGLATGAQAQSTQSGTTAQGTTAGARDAVPEADRDFMKKAAEAGHAEVQAARLAVSKSTNAQVKKFAQMLIDDHTKANAQLEQIASAKGVKLPTEPSLMHKSKMQLMKMADGADFDKRFAEDMGVEAHRETIELFREGIANGRDPQVKAFAQQVLPKLEQHLEMAQKMRTQLERRESSTR